MTERDDNDLYSEVWIYAGNNGLMDQDQDQDRTDPETIPWYNKVSPPRWEPKVEKNKKYLDELREKEWLKDMKRYEKEKERQARGCPVAPDDRGFAPADDL